MRKIILFITLIVILFNSHAQVVSNGSFDDNITGWGSFKGSKISHTSSEGADKPGALQITDTEIGTGIINEFKIKPTKAGNYLLTFKVKGNAGNKIIANVQQFKTHHPGTLLKIKKTGVWHEYSFIFKNIINTKNMKIRIVSRTPNATLLVDDINFELQ